MNDSADKKRSEVRPFRSPATERALKEAEERRRQRDAQKTDAPPETGGQKGPDPTRHGDWEKGGIVSDF